MEFNSYLRKPFKVEAIEITEENLDEIAKDVGTINTKGNGSRFIMVDRRLVPNVLEVFPGYWLTRLGPNIRCFPGYVFNSQFVKVDEVVEDLLKKLNATDDKPTSFPEEGKLQGVEDATT